MLIEAGFQCEYCKRSLRNTVYDRDHIVPVNKGGPTVRHNLAVSCDRCNTNKGGNMYWKNPLTWMETQLFHPRTMRWHDHFRRVGGETRGRTNIGRATCALLFRDTPQYIPRDLQWEETLTFSDNRVLYEYFNLLHYWRLRNRFADLHKALRIPLSKLQASRSQTAVAEHLRSLLLLELYFTRSREGDVAQGISLAESLLATYVNRPLEMSQLLAILSILYQQKATIRFIGGHGREALSDQRQALRYYSASRRAGHSLTDQRTNDFQKCAGLLWMRSLSAKYYQTEVRPAEIRRSESLIAEGDPWEAMGAYKHLIDSMLSMPRVPCSLGEQAYLRASSMLEHGGYGTDTDYARPINLRRRWWVLHMMYETSPDFDLFLADLEFWKQINMFNGTRELYSLMKRSSRLLAPSITRRIQEVFCTFLPLSSREEGNA